jgi:hypothetical protein
MAGTADFCPLNVTARFNVSSPPFLSAPLTSPRGGGGLTHRPVKVVATSRKYSELGCGNAQDRTSPNANPIRDARHRRL